MLYWILRQFRYEIRSFPTWSRLRILAEKSGAFTAIVVLVGILSAWPVFKGAFGSADVVAEMESLSVVSTMWLVAAIVLFISAAVIYGSKLNPMTASWVYFHDWASARQQNLCVAGIIKNEEDLERGTNSLQLFWESDEYQWRWARISITLLSAGSLLCLVGALATMAVAVYRANTNNEPASDPQVEIVAAPENPPAPEDAMMN